MSFDEKVFDVIIVGCGPAGIAAAIDFQSIPSLEYIILEARNRIGGRVVTDVTTFGENAAVDLGAQWLHHYRPENPLHKYFQASRDAPLNYNFVLHSSETPFYDIDGRRISREKIDQAEQIVKSLCMKIQQSSFDMDESMYDVIKGEYGKYNDDQELKRLIDLFFGFIEQYEGSNLDQLSAKSYLKSDNGIPECNLAIPNGFGRALEEIVEKYKLNIKLNSIVTRIDASLTDSYVHVYTDDGRLFKCKYVLVTIPLGCLKNNSIEFIPKLPEWKQNAIDKMGVALSNKIFLQFSYCFWDPNISAFFCTSERFRFILCRPNVSMLLVKTAARVALETETQNEHDVIDEVMVLLRKIFSDREVPQPTRYLITKWNEDKFAQGSYANFAVGTDNQTLIDLAQQCHDRIYWAGEHTNCFGTIGCVDSAFESGQRAANQLIKQLHFENK